MTCKFNGILKGIMNCRKCNMNNKTYCELRTIIELLKDFRINYLSSLDNMTSEVYIPYTIKKLEEIINK